MSAKSIGKTAFLGVAWPRGAKLRLARRAQQMPGSRSSDAEYSSGRSGNGPLYQAGLGLENRTKPE